MKAAPLERNDLLSGGAVQHMAAEYTSEHMPWMPADDALRAANPDAPRLIQDYYEDWFRADGPASWAHSSPTCGARRVAG